MNAKANTRLPGARHKVSGLLNRDASRYYGRNWSIDADYRLLLTFPRKLQIVYLWAMVIMA